MPPVCVGVQLKVSNLFTVLSLNTSREENCCVRQHDISTDVPQECLLAMLLTTAVSIYWVLV